MPASVAATGWCFMKSSTNSSLSAVNVRIVSIMRRGAWGPGRAGRGGCAGAGNLIMISAFGVSSLTPARARETCGRARSDPGPPSESNATSGLGDVRGLLALGPRDEVELDPVALGERAEPVRADGAEVHEHVLARVRGDEAEPLGIVEPLDRALDAAL